MPTMSTDTVRANLEHVRERIARAAERSGRRAAEILLIGVSKTVDAERIRPAIDAGIAALGENRVQEARAKVPVLGRTVAWHLIGHLQTNKVKDAIELFDVIQTVDRLPLAEELERRAAAAGRDVQVLVEVNLAAEPPKSGVLPDALPQMLEQVAALPHLRVRGLMAIPPMGTPDDARPWFRALRKLAETHGLAELSMGMSADYETAIEEGATMVRVGTAIFGARPPRA
jgi:pyridoxal phosphate enzyme (YggS family)